MTTFGRYFNLLKRSGFGFNLPKGSLINYARIRLGILGDASKIGGGGGGTVYPALISIRVNQRCNLKCSFCYLQRDGVPQNWNEYEVTEKKFQNLLNQNFVKKTLIFLFQGGEPLLNKDLPKMIKMARDNRYLTAIITNGLLLDKHIDELVEAGLCDVQLSVYSNTIEKLKPILPIVAPRVPINISFVLTKSYLDSIANINFRPLIDLILLCRDCSSFKFNICQPQHGSNDFSETICTGDANYERFVDLCKRELKNVVFEGYKARRFHLSFNHFSVFMPDPLDLTSDKRGCKQPWSFCVLDGVGNAYICCGCCTDKQVFEASDPNIDVFDRCEGALNSPKAQKVRSSLRDKNAPLQPECVDCAFRVGGYSSNI